MQSQRQNGKRSVVKVSCRRRQKASAASSVHSDSTVLDPA